MAKKETKSNLSPTESGIVAESSQLGDRPDGENLPPVKKSGWKGPPGSIYRDGRKGISKLKPSGVLKDYRAVYAGTLSTSDMAKASIQSILQLKMEDNARFLAEYAKLEREHDDRKARHRLEVHKGIAETAKAEVPKDATTEDTLLLLDELLAEAVAASKT